MQQYFEDLSYYKDQKKSLHCRLDPRYFERVFRRYPGLRNPISLTIKDKKFPLNQNEKVFLFHTEQNKPIDKNFTGVARLSIGDMCNLLIFDYKNKILYRIEPFGNTAPHFEHVNKFLEQMKKDDYKLVNIDFKKPVLNRTCDIAGYSVNFCIFYAYAYILGIRFEPESIKQFATFVKRKYILPEGGTTEVEYELFGDGDEKGGSLLGGVTLVK